MLSLLFSVGNDRYALDSTRIVEVIPVVEFKKILRAPNYIAGVFNYRGKSVPVVDLCMLMRQKPSHLRLSTRMALVEYSNPDRQEKTVHTIALMAERMTETVKVDPQELVKSGVHVDQLPFLGELFKVGEEMIQCILLDSLLETVALKEVLFS